MMEGELYIVGTIHLDIASAPVLGRLLERLDPCAITVEISRFSVEFRSSMEERWQERLRRILDAVPEARNHYRVELLRRQLSMPFEWTVSSSYASVRGIRCMAVDSGALAREELPSWMDTLLTEDNVRALASLPVVEMDDYFARHRREALETLSGQRNVVTFPPASKFWGRRENILRKRVDRIRKKFKRTVHVGGWTHAVPFGGGTLASRLMPDLKGIFLVLPGEWKSFPVSC